MLTLYHAPQSRSSRIVWLLEELGGNYRLKITDIPRLTGAGAGGRPRATPTPTRRSPRSTTTARW